MHVLHTGTWPAGGDSHFSLLSFDETSIVIPPPAAAVDRDVGDGGVGEEGASSVSLPPTFTGGGTRGLAVRGESGVSVTEIEVVRRVPFPCFFRLLLPGAALGTRGLAVMLLWVRRVSERRVSLPFPFRLLLPGAALGTRGLTVREGSVVSVVVCVEMLLRFLFFLLLAFLFLL
jgi:hypothetical protein